jgi:hypothetical protein
LDFTLGQDNLTGSCFDDIIGALIEFNTNSGSQIATLQTGDSVDGLAGSDTLIASFTVAGTVVPASIASIEKIFLTNFSDGTFTLSATNISGVEMIETHSSINDVIITGLQESTDFGFKDIPGLSGNDGTSVDMSLTFALDSITAATDDQITCNLENAIVGAAKITTASTNGFEIVNIVSAGTTTNRLTSLVQTTGTTLHTIVITGSADLELGTVPASVVSIDTSGFSGTLTRLP